MLFCNIVFGSKIILLVVHEDCEETWVCGIFV